MNAGAGGISNIGTINAGNGTFTVNTAGAATQNTGDKITGATTLSRLASAPSL